MEVLGRILFSLWKLPSAVSLLFLSKLVALSEIVQDFIYLLLPCFLLPRRVELGAMRTWRVEQRRGSPFAQLLDFGEKLF